MKHVVVGWGALFAAVLTAPIEWFKNALLFHPSTVVDATPADYGLAYEAVRFGGQDDTLLHGWYIPGPGEIVFIWFHGNAGNIRTRLEHVRLMHDQVGGSHLLFDYQGFGLSQGSPSIHGILADGRAAARLIQERGWAQGKRVVFFGESLGCAVVISLAVALGAAAPGEGIAPRAITPDRIILEAPFYSLHAMGRIVLPPLAFIVKDNLNSARLITQLTVPVLIIHGKQDETVPFQQGRELYNAAPQPKRFYAVSGGGHSGLYEVGGQRYFQTIQGFVDLVPNASSLGPTE